ncbi:hypothetical protein PRZ48_000255 [Zasmidium cellare]|uniref:Uncharacterized protein n=1 Tax=Zasmidium cellare TaxID=395010 RepID=A0ABR0EZ79_ZASCE|nr:hypothetical protein PRZ48_000255 [Zasmidium cellare]
MSALPLAKTCEPQNASDTFSELMRELPLAKTSEPQNASNTFSELITQPKAVATKSRFDFLNLPASVRNRIYWLTSRTDNSRRADREKYDWYSAKPAIVLQTEDGLKYSWNDPDEALGTCFNRL